jgi:hypothetical protein
LLLAYWPVALNKKLHQLKHQLQHLLQKPLHLLLLLKPLHLLLTLHLLLLLMLLQLLLLKLHLLLLLNQLKLSNLSLPSLWVKKGRFAAFLLFVPATNISSNRHDLESNYQTNHPANHLTQ